MYNTTKPYNDRIQSIIQSTWDSKYFNQRLGRTVDGNALYPITTESFSGTRWIVDHVDGIGTKGYYHWKEKQWWCAARDAIAMNLNDLLMVRAIPFKIQNHLILPEDDTSAIIHIIEALANDCNSYGIAITGGETSIHENYSGMELSITMSGEVKDYPVKNEFKNGDHLISLSSNGLHSNGFTKIREIFGDETREEFTRATELYFNPVWDIIDKVNGIMHITGGAFSKLKNILNSGQNASIYDAVKPQSIFYEIYDKVKEDDKLMYTTFNCGTGMILSVSHYNVHKVLNHFGNKAVVIGEVESGNGDVNIISAFSGKKVKV